MSDARALLEHYRALQAGMDRYNSPQARAARARIAGLEAGQRLKEQMAANAARAADQRKAQHQRALAADATTDNSRTSVPRIDAVGDGDVPANISSALQAGSRAAPAGIAGQIAAFQTANGLV